MLGPSSRGVQVSHAPCILVLMFDLELLQFLSLCHCTRSFFLVMVFSCTASSSVITFMLLFALLYVIMMFLVLLSSLILFVFSTRVPFPFSVIVLFALSFLVFVFLSFLLLLFLCRYVWRHLCASALFLYSLPAAGI